MKLYAALQERSLPLAFHAATNWGDQSMHITNRFIATPCARLHLVQHRHLTNWVVNGIPERFPGLKTRLDRERAGLGSVPDAAARQRIHDAQLGSACLKRKPSDYMREMFFTTQPMEMIGNQTMLQETFR